MSLSSRLLAILSTFKKHGIICRMIENMINDCSPSCIMCCSEVPGFKMRIIRFHLVIIFSQILLFIVGDPCVIHIDSLRGNRVDSKLLIATMAIVLLISKVLSSIRCNIIRIKALVMLHWIQVWHYLPEHFVVHIDLQGRRRGLEPKRGSIAPAFFAYNLKHIFLFTILVDSVSN